MAACTHLSCTLNDLRFQRAKFVRGELFPSRPRGTNSAPPPPAPSGKNCFGRVTPAFGSTSRSFWSVGGIH